MKDYLVRGLVNSKNCRVFACQTTNLLEKARQEHDLWPTASAALGRMMSATLMMAAMNKNNEKMTVTINGGGPIGTMMAVTRGDGHIKGFVGDPHVHYTYNDTGHLAVGVAVGTQGTLQVIRDMGLKEPFCGTVPLQTGEIGDDFSYYFMASEQTPSVVSVGVLVDETNEILSSGGFIIQLLPEATEEDISYIEEKIKDGKIEFTIDIRKIEISKFINYLTKKISIIDIDIDSGNIDNVIIKLYEDFKI